MKEGDIVEYGGLFGSAPIMRVNPFLQKTSSVEGAEYLHHYKALRINGEGGLYGEKGNRPLSHNEEVLFWKEILAVGDIVELKATLWE